MRTISAVEEEQNAAAAARVTARADTRAENIRVLSEPGGLAKADSPERVAKRLDRLASYHLDEPLPVRSAGDTPAAAPDERMRTAARRIASSTRVPAVPAKDGDDPERVLERVINNADFLEFRYLDAGTVAGRAVGRVVLRDDHQRLAGYGTGSLISPRLLLTNHHVLPDAATAARSVVQFNFQYGLDGKPLHEQQFGFDPDAFFVSDGERDFSIVAVDGSADDLAQFGFNPLIGAEGKVIVGERVTIVQHPAGEMKQIVLRDQQVVDVADTPFLYYLADTEHGSSGSPVFNDQWEIVALHHASVPRSAARGAPTDTPAYVNEGVRVSRILRFVDEDAKLTDAQRALLGAIDVRTAQPTATPPPPAPDPPTKEPEVPQPPSTSLTTAVPDGDGWVQITVPLEIRLRLGQPLAGTQVVVASPAAAAAPAVAPLAGDQEAVVIDPDWAAREGFDTGFLGAGHEVPLPALSAEQQPLASVDATRPDAPTIVLRYHHYSVVMNSQRRLAYWVGVNIDGALHRRSELKRANDRWFFDPRIPEDDQVGEELYTKNALDRGHLVRRLDPGWGVDLETAKKANDDTFHFTNCTPQHENFNQNKTTWAGIEDYILNNADERNFKASIFTGPVFADDDDMYRGVKLPRQFWKVAVMVKSDGTLSATGYLLSQEELIRGLESEEEFNYGAYKTFQVKVSKVEELTGLSFGPLPASDPLERVESTVDVLPVESLDALIL